MGESKQAASAGADGKWLCTCTCLLLCSCVLVVGPTLPLLLSRPLWMMSSSTMAYSPLLSGSCHHLGPVKYTCTVNTRKTYITWLPNSFSPEPIVSFSVLVLCLWPSLTEQVLVNHLRWSFLYWKVTSSVYFVFYPGGDHSSHPCKSDSSLLQHLCTDNHSVLSTPAHTLRHCRAHHHRAIPVMWVTSPSRPSTDMLPSASLLNCPHLWAPSSVTLWPSAHAGSLWGRTGITLSPIPRTPGIKPSLRQTLRTGYEMNDQSEAQSCTCQEAICIPKTRSTHVAHAGLKLALVAEDDLELVTLSLLPKCGNYSCVPPLTVFICCQDWTQRFVILSRATTDWATAQPPFPKAFLIVRLKNDLSSHLLSLKGSFALVPTENRRDPKSSWVVRGLELKIFTDYITIKLTDF